MFGGNGDWNEDGTDKSDLFSGGMSDFTEVDDKDELCDCDPKYKETQVVQKSTGASFGGFGGQVGDGTTVIICKNCGERFHEKEQSQDQNNSIF